MKCLLEPLSVVFKLSSYAVAPEEVLSILLFRYDAHLDRRRLRPVKPNLGPSEVECAPRNGKGRAMATCPTLWCPQWPIKEAYIPARGASNEHGLGVNATTF